MIHRTDDGMRWKCRVAYDGTDFNGWQSQPNGNTIQDYLERRIQSIFQRHIRIHGSGRTDSGVHARGQVFHFDGTWRHPVAHLQRALRSGLPERIQVHSVRRAPKSFHARYGAREKLYAYRIYEGYASPMDTRFYWSLGDRSLDVGAMQAAAQALIGKYDFSAFAVERGDGTRENPVKELTMLKVTRRHRRITIQAQAGGFLYKMVRSLVGALVDVGTKKLTGEQLRAILRSQKRTALVATAPARGLCLERVSY